MLKRKKVSDILWRISVKCSSASHFFNSTWKLLTRSCFGRKTLDRVIKYYPVAIQLSFSANLVLEYKVQNIIFWVISNTVTCHIFVALNIKLYSEKDLRDTKNCWNCKFHRVCMEFWSWSCFLIQSLTKYTKTDLWNQVKLDFCGKFNN